MVYRVYITKEVLTYADSWEEACENALNEDNFIMSDEYLDDERNGTDGGCEKE